LRDSRSLRASARRFRLSVDSAFDEVLERCADPRRPGSWITPAVARAYRELHRLGWAHSVEAWAPDGRLAGGLYGVAIGGLVAGESMFHASWPQARDASKAALVGLVMALRADAEQRRLLDVQWCTPHLATLGCIEVPREHYLRLLDDALGAPLPAVFTERSTYVEGRSPNGGTDLSAGQPHPVGGTVLE
jgi:leucyl/phenylalanyl-tRNA--protein transferase